MKKQNDEMPKTLEEYFIMKMEKAEKNLQSYTEAANEKDKDIAEQAREIESLKKEVEDLKESLRFIFRKFAFLEEEDYISCTMCGVLGDDEDYPRIKALLDAYNE